MPHYTTLSEAKNGCPVSIYGVIPHQGICLEFREQLLIEISEPNGAWICEHERTGNE